MKKRDPERKSQQMNTASSDRGQKVQKSVEIAQKPSTESTSSSKPSEAVNEHCGCKDKRDVFFDKLLCFLEKQSEVISKCCWGHTRNSQCNTGTNTNIEDCEDQKFLKAPSACTDHNAAKTSSFIDNKLRVDKKDLPCRVIVEVCTCGKNKQNNMNESFSNRNLYSSKDKSTDCKSNRKHDIHTQYSNKSIASECQGCDEKVNRFFKLADEICQEYLRRCLVDDKSKDIQPLEVVEIGPRHLGAPSEQDYENTTKSGTEWHYTKKSERGCGSLAVEIECQGDKEEFIVQPCECPQKPTRGQVASNYESPRAVGSRSKEACLELFEERYGKILRQLHSKLISPEEKDYPNYSNQQPYNYQGQNQLPPGTYSQPHPSAQVLPASTYQSPPYQNFNSQPQQAGNAQQPPNYPSGQQGYYGRPTGAPSNDMDYSVKPDQKPTDKKNSKSFNKGRKKKNKDS